MDALDSFESHLLRKLYEKTSRNGDKLAQAEKQVDWEAFRPLVKAMYANDTPLGGRPNTDEVLMVKLLALQLGVAEAVPCLEDQALNHINFQHFLGFPGDAPDYSTVWSFRERLATTGTDRLIWEEQQRPPRHPTGPRRPRRPCRPGQEGVHAGIPEPLPRRHRGIPIGPRRGPAERERETARSQPPGQGAWRVHGGGAGGRGQPVRVSTDLRAP